MPKEFLIEAPPKDNRKEVGRKADIKLEEAKPSCKWKLYTDGASSSDGSGTMLLLIDPEEYSNEYIKIRIKVPQYKLIRGNLYKKSFYTLWLCCIASLRTYEVVKEIHEGSCGFNAKLRSMVVRITKFGVPQIISLKDDKNFKEGIFTDLCRGLKITQSFFPIIKHMLITSKIEKQLTRSQQGWVDDLSQILWVHRTLSRNNQKDTPFSLTYGSESIFLTIKSNKDNRGRTKKVTKRKESMEVASSKESYYQNELRRYHSKRSYHSTYKVGDFVLLLQNSTENSQIWQGPHMIREVHDGELYKIIDASDHSLIQTEKRTNIRKFYM
nr:hypothetical protein [Tanacetum cinerariifolium]